MCLEAGIAREKKIAVTEPRRVAAQTLAVRVAYEMGTEIREKVLNFMRSVTYPYFR